MTSKDTIRGAAALMQHGALGFGRCAQEPWRHNHTKIRQPKIAVLEARCFVSRWESALTTRQVGAKCMGRVRIGRIAVCLCRGLGDK
jgi:hypothetical protein